MESALRIVHTCSFQVLARSLGEGWRGRGTHQKVPVGQGVPEDQGDLEGQVVPSQLFLEFQEFLESLGVPGVLGVLEVQEGHWAQEVLPSFLKDKIQCYICSY